MATLVGIPVAVGYLIHNPLIMLLDHLMFPMK